MYKNIDSCSYKDNACYLLEICNKEYASSKRSLYRVCCTCGKDIILLKFFDDYYSAYRCFIKSCKKYLFPNALFKCLEIYFKDLI